MATTHDGLGDFSQALRNHEQAFRLDPSGKTNQNINNEYGMALFRDGDEPRARETFELARARSQARRPSLSCLARSLPRQIGRGKTTSAGALLSDENYLRAVKPRLNAWKDADPGLPLLKDALSPKKEIDSKT